MLQSCFLHLYFDTLMSLLSQFHHIHESISCSAGSFEYHNSYPVCSGSKRESGVPFEMKLLLFIQRLRVVCNQEQLQALFSIASTYWIKRQRKGLWSWGGFEKACPRNDGNMFLSDKKIMTQKLMLGFDPKCCFLSRKWAHSCETPELRLLYVCVQIMTQVISKMEYRANLVGV